MSRASRSSSVLLRLSILEWPFLGSKVCIAELLLLSRYWDSGLFRSPASLRLLGFYPPFLTPSTVLVSHWLSHHLFPFWLPGPFSVFSLTRSPPVYLRDNLYRRGCGDHVNTSILFSVPGSGFRPYSCRIYVWSCAVLGTTTTLRVWMWYHSSILAVPVLYS